MVIAREDIRVSGGKCRKVGKLFLYSFEKAARATQITAGAESNHGGKSAEQPSRKKGVSENKKQKLL